MGHNHDHQHHELRIADVNKALIFGIILNIIFVLLEVIAGLRYDSLALLSDAGHNFSDVIALVLALVAFKLLAIAPNLNYTYGYRKTTILAALINALLLLTAVGVILWESIDRWLNPVVINGSVTAMIASFGIVINGFTAWLFVKDKDKDLNIKGAYLHMLADTLVSIGVVISGLVIWWTDWYWVDTVMSWVIVAMIMLSTWSLFKDSIRLILDGVPKEINLASIRQKILEMDGIVSMHHIHVWALSTAENAMTAHLVIQQACTFEDAAVLKSKIKHLLEHENIKHVTLEIEKKDETCSATACTIVSEQEDHHHHEH
ncbi:cation diffusion facilitator family transporter [Aureispira anguillae]|uniref:Cation diffusion facilitator family transporter n=1 Tax=Aureispira anguillae TaxID=2864201 RepID=A0A915YI73_9BACT|nr:cation diffusion facilitator family transporter [Aureispira anguillae]BDS13538.1 cation diffusion facilitator family transporter [Aureispira anguillae]